MIDVAELKKRVNIVDLAGRYASLDRWTRGGEMAGPCPKCSDGGRDRFHVHPEGWWKCYRCHPKRADVIELVIFLRLAPDFKEAAAWLARYAGGEVPNLPALKTAAPKPAPKAKGWHDPGWQRKARATLAAAVAMLASPAGDPGRAYLVGRGLQPETWQAWGLGYDPAKWDTLQKRKRPAIVMPWHWPPELCALKYRFLDSKEKSDRFISMGGSEQRLYGLQMCGHEQALILCEGELNALAIWQAARAGGLGGFDVVSFGSENAGASQWAAKVAARYGRVIVWTDEEDRAQKAMANIPGALGKRSPYGLDANDLLKGGRLVGFLRAILAELPTPAKEDAYLLAMVEAQDKIALHHWPAGLGDWLQGPAGQDLGRAITAAGAELDVMAASGQDLAKFTEACAAWAELHKQAAEVYIAGLWADYDRTPAAIGAAVAMAGQAARRASSWPSGRR